MTKSHLNVNNNALTDSEGELRYDPTGKVLNYRDDTGEQTVEVNTASSTAMFTGTYAGTAGALPITGVPFQPRLVQVFVGSGGASLGSLFLREANHTGTDSFEVSAGTIVTDAITAINADGFDVGLNAGINSVGTNYIYICFK
jgi:hypothetical protein